MLEKYVTPNGKEISPYYDGRNIRIKFTTGGELPECLSGVYTNPTQVNKAIIKYLSELSYPKGKVVEKDMTKYIKAD